MSPIAIFYHARINGTPANIDESKAESIMRNQVCCLEETGLMESSSEFHVNYHGPERGSVLANDVSGNGSIFTHTPDNDNGLDGELPTLGMLQDWLPNHPDWLVFYFHTKGVTKPDDPLRVAWRDCMMKATVVRWRECVSALESGMDMAGAHWLTTADLTPGTKNLVGQIWGGNFFWARASYLISLPPLARKVNPEKGIDRYWAEGWVGKGKNPRVLDLAPHWPSIESCRNNL